MGKELRKRTQLHDYEEKSKGSPRKETGRLFRAFWGPDFSTTGQEALALLGGETKAHGGSCDARGSKGITTGGTWG